MIRSVSRPDIARNGEDRDAIDRILERTKDLEQRAIALTGALRTVYPHAAVYACALSQNGHRHGHAINGSGVNSPSWTAEILDLAARASSPRRARAGRKSSSAALSRQAGIVLKSQPVEFRHESMGIVAIGMDVCSGSWAASSIEAILRGFAIHLGASLYVEQRESEWEQENADIESVYGLAKIGELIDPVAHEVNNFLNAALLQMAVMQSKMPSEARGNLSEIRRQGEQLTETIRELQQYRRVDRRVQQDIDLNSVILGSVAGLQSASPADQLDRPNGKPEISIAGALEVTAKNGVPVRLRLSPKPALVSGSTTDLRYLCAFLLRNAVGAAASRGGDVVVRTEAAADGVVLQVEDGGPTVGPEQLPRLFEPSVVHRDGTSSLELAACKSLVKRLKGKIQGLNRPGGGAAIQVTLPPAACA